MSALELTTIGNQILLPLALLAWIGLETHSGMPDMPVPKTDTTLLEGNHVFLDC